MKKFTQGTLTDRLARFLFHVRNTPHTTTGSTPAELLPGRRPRSRLDLILPDVGSHVAKKQWKQKEAHDAKAHDCHFAVGDMVYTRAYGQGQPQWMPAQITHHTGPVSYKVTLDDGTVYRRHQDQLRWRLDTDTAATDTPPQSAESTELPTSVDCTEPSVTQNSPPSPTPIESATLVPTPTTPIPTHCYPTRDRRPPERLTYTSL